MNTLKLLNFNSLEINEQLNNLNSMDKLKLANSLLLDKENKSRNFNEVVKIMTFRKLIEKKLKAMQKAQNELELELHNRKEVTNE